MKFGCACLSVEKLIIFADLRDEKSPVNCTRTTERSRTNHQQTIGTQRPQTGRLFACFFPLDFSDTYVFQARNIRHMSANRQWKVVDGRDSNNILANDHWYSTHISCTVRVRTTLLTTRKTRILCVVHAFTRLFGQCDRVFICAAIKKRHILLKEFHLIALDINIVKYPYGLALAHQEYSYVRAPTRRFPSY